MERKNLKIFLKVFYFLILVLVFSGCMKAITRAEKDFSWWGKSGATPLPVKDKERGGEWWWPEKPLEKQKTQWGNRGYVYLNLSSEKKPVSEAKPSKIKKEEKQLSQQSQSEEKQFQPAEKVVEKTVEKIVEKIAYINFKDIFFEFDSAELLSLAKKDIEENAKILEKHPEIKVILEGYASPEGTEKYNLKLSERRAKSVYEYLIKIGIKKERITTKGCGEVNVEKQAWPFVRKVHFSIKTAE